MMCQIMRTARAGVVCVGMGNHGSRHRTPRIDMKIARRTEQAFIGGDDDQITHAVRRPCDSSNIDTCRCDNRSAGMLQGMRSAPRLWAPGRRRPADAAAGRFHITGVSVEIPGDLTEQFDGLVFPPRSLIASRSVVTRGRQLDDHSVVLGADTHKLIEDTDRTVVLLITFRNPPLVAVAHAGIAIITRTGHQVRRVWGDRGLYPVSGDDLLAVELAVQAERLTDTRIITGGSIETG